MTRQKSLILTRKWMEKLDQDRLDSELATNVLRESEQTYSLEQVKLEISANARTRHRKPRKID